MKFREVVSRVTGLSVPIFGAQWNPPEAECVVARRVLAFLEDRRVLFVPSEMEVPRHCVESVLRIREFLTAELGKLDAEKELPLSLRAMRAACRKFLATVETDDRHVIQFGAHQGHYASWIFNGAVGELRGVFGVHIARLAASHGLDIEGELASILPAPADER
ncbi:hypothetical protein Rfer_3556 [Rhodoferax ferrireducens T118]|uniref:Uncharacterized protein n=1 Tax=Albidiferax ferrireducens (strain ATCC BAA-621 / DSM 15236 / T118) TaxID=338969 RepID=Q21SJ3_ALBFT|nr:DUF6650 family protein [Rhodoferax ferrireducens]ABD71260.1 hypothetical protein Rfer_3556 [Rhodoferax ferrireducens T118]